MKGNDYKPCNFFDTSVKQYIANKDLTSKENKRPIHAVLEKIAVNNMDISKLDDKQQKFVTEHLSVDKETIIQIENETLTQAASNRWYEERKKRITASNFGSVINRRPTIYPKSLLQNLLQSKKFKSTACDWGKENEKHAIKCYEDITSNTVTKCGFIVNPKFPWLGASPDGLISLNNECYKILEVKCPFTKRDVSIKESCLDKSFCLKMENSTPKLKDSHIYYYQCQGLMAVTETLELDFMVYTDIDTHVEKIKFDALRWEGCFLPRLTKFYFDFLMDKIF